MSSDLAVAILAGGEGSRLGGGKPLRSLGGERLVDRVLTTAREWSDAVAVAVRDDAQVAGVDIAFIRDEADIDGPLGGLVAGLRFAKSEAREFALVIPADMPFLPQDLAVRLTAELGPAQAALAASGGHLHPVCGLWRASAVHSLPAYLASGQRSLKGFAAQVGYRAVEWPAEPLDPFFNINTPEDLAFAERVVGR